MTRHADLLVIGAGPGGYVAALRAAQGGASVVLAERRYIGGVCLNEGCIPIKALLRSAEVLTLARRAGEFGVEIGPPRLNWARVQERRAALVRQLTGQVDMLLARAGVQVLRGAATFVSPHIVQVQVGDGVERIEARDVIIAAGSHASRPSIPGLDGPGVIDHVAALSLEALPRSLLIIGAGAEGVEFASAFAAYGVDVTVVEMLPHLLPLMDRDLGAGLAFAFTQRGIKLHLDSSVTAVEPGRAGPVARLKTPAGEVTVEAELILVCAGRRASVAGLGLEAAGVRFTRAGIAVDERMRTSVPHVYAVGDVTGGKMLAHLASRQGEIAVADALGTTPAPDGAVVPACVFADPEIASVGLTEGEARRLGYDVRIGKFPLNGNGKALVAGDADGFVKIVSEGQYGEVLGVHIIGLHASDLILEGTLALTLEVTLDELEAAMRPHPSLGEAVAEAVQAVTGRAIHSPRSYAALTTTVPHAHCGGDDV